MRTLVPGGLVAAALLALLAACGQKKEPAAPAAPGTPAAPTAAAPAATTPPPAAAPAAAADLEQAKSVYNKACGLCHAAGVAGAPKPGDKADWGPRIAQGKEVLYKHALEGFTGSKGAMPARGGSTTLTDQEVKAVVDYMVTLSQ